MNRFWDMLEASIIVQGVVTVGLIGSMIYLWVTGRAVPNELYVFGSLVLGFWFGTKSQFALQQRAHSKKVG